MLLKAIEKRVTLNFLMLSKKQDRIILDRFKTGKALNLSVMNYYHPDIIEASFGDVDCLGWRKNLLRIGIDPYSIDHEHFEEVECLICGNQYNVLSVHLQQAHGYTSDDYTAEFGKWVELSSDTFRSRKFKNLPLEGLPHWEYLWSPHYIIDYVIAMDEVGFPCNSNFAQEEVRLVTRALRYFSGWDEVLRHANVEGARLKSVEKQWSKQMIIDSLQRFEQLRKNGSKKKMSNTLMCAIPRYFKKTRGSIQGGGSGP